MELKRGKIMVVDDDMAIIDAFDAIFGDNYDLITTTRGLEAIKLFKTQNPQLIFLDIKIPDIDGIDVLKAIRKIDQHVKIVIITGTNHNYKPQAEKIGIDGYYRKPLDVNDMEKIAKDLIN